MKQLSLLPILILLPLLGRAQVTSADISGVSSIYNLTSDSSNAMTVSIHPTGSGDVILEADISHYRWSISPSSRTVTVEDGVTSQLTFTLNTTATGAGYIFWRVYDAETEDLLKETLQWVEIPNPVYTVTLNHLGGTNETNAVNPTYGSPMPQASAPTRTGYQFQGYYRAENGEGVIYYNSDMSSARDWEESYSRTIYAYWLANTYSVTLDDQGGSDGTGNVTATYGSPMPAASAPHKNGYSFGGYFSSKNGVGEKYYNSDMTSARDWDIASPSTLFAHWVAPDLIVAEVEVTAATYPRNKRIEAQATIRNAGSGDAGSSKIYYYLGSTNGTTQDGPTTNYADIEQGSIAEILPKGEDEDAINGFGWQIPEDITNGTYRIWVKADVDNEVAESDELNNWGFSEEFSIAPEPQILSAYWSTPLDVSNGDIATMYAEVEGIPTGKYCSFQVYEDDGNWPSDTKEGNPVYGIVYDVDGKTYVKASFTAEWKDDEGSNPEYYFEVTYDDSAPVLSSRDRDDELIVRSDRQVPCATRGDFYYSEGEATSQATLTDDRIPLILVHGAGGDQMPNSLNYWYGWANGDMSPEGAQLGHFNSDEMRSHFRVYRYVYDSRRSIAENGEEFATFVNEYYASNPELDGRQVVIMAHSMGGLVSRYALNSDSAFSSKVHKLITLGTPHLGTPLANPTWVWQDKGDWTLRELTKNSLHRLNFRNVAGDFDLAWYQPEDIPSPAVIEGSFYTATVQNDFLNKDLLDAGLTTPLTGDATMTNTSNDGKIIAYGGYFTGVPIIGNGPDWPEDVADEFMAHGITNHTDLFHLRDLLSDMNYENGDSVGNNDGMVSISSALLNGRTNVEQINLTELTKEPVDHSSYLDVESTMEQIAARLLTMTKVTILPENAINAGAQWRLSGGEWQKSGTCLNALRPGEYIVEFKDVEGWVTPGDAAITVTEGKTAVLSTEAARYSVAPKLQLAPNSYDFGEIVIQTTSTCTITITNIGGGTLSGSATVSAPYSIVSGETYSLLTNESQSVEIKYAPTEVGKYDATVTFTGVDGASATLTGTACPHPAISVTPASRDFGEIEVGSAADKTFTISNTGGGTLSGTVTVTEPYIVLSGGSYDLGKDENQDVTICYTPTVEGTHSGTVTFTGGGGTTASVIGSSIPSANEPPVIESAAFVDDNPVTLPDSTEVHVVASDPDSDDPLNYKWTMVNGPAEPTWSTPEAADCEVTFHKAGDYLLLVSVSDSKGGSITSQVEVTVNPLPTYEVSYNENGATAGVAPAAQEKTTGIDLILAANSGKLSKTGFSFAGWNTKQDGTGTDYSEGASYTDDAPVILYAKWTTQTVFVVSYNANGATTGTTPPNQTKTQGIDLAIAGNSGNLGKEGYSFSGWNTSSTGDGTSYPAGAAYSGDADVILFAIWTASTYTVTFNGNSSDAVVPKGIEVTFDSAYGELKEANRLGYAFTGWFTDTDDGTLVTDTTVVSIAADHTLFAHWEALPRYTVSYNENGATEGDVPENQEKIHGITLFVSGNSGSLSKEGCSFAGWNTEQEGTGTDYAEGAGYSDDGPLTLYAKWTTLPIYIVTYNANGAIDGVPPVNQTKTQGIPLTLAGNYGNLTKPGYTFTSWNTQADGSGTSYLEGATYIADAALTLYAEWTANTYTVRFDSNGGETSQPTSIQVTYGNTYGALANSNRDGYTFTGWFTEITGGTQVTESTAVTYAADHTLYAKWTEESTGGSTDDDNAGSTGGGSVGCFVGHNPSSELLVLLLAVSAVAAALRFAGVKVRNVQS
jgi:uncharacterized repeat protein (TIGR02543 family)